MLHKTICKASYFVTKISSATNVAKGFIYNVIASLYNIKLKQFKNHTFNCVLDGESSVLKSPVHIFFSQNYMILKVLVRYGNPNIIMHLSKHLHVILLLF